MRLLLFVLSLIVGIMLGTPPSQGQARAAARDWTVVTTPQPSGGWAVGNPAARVKLAEWVSYTCSHCADFAAQSKAELAPMIRSGQVQVEYRTLPRDTLDLAAGLLVRCGGPARFAGAHAAVFAAHRSLMDRAQAYETTSGARQAGATLAARLGGIAEGSGLRALMRSRGLSDAQMDRCLSDEAATRRLIAIAEAAQAAGIPGTPSFEIAGKRVEAGNWTELKPLLAAK